jgi:hypothetical protein
MAGSRASGAGAPDRPANRYTWRHDEQDHEGGRGAAGGPRCRQAGSDPRAGRAREQPQGRSVEIPKRRLTVFTGVSGSGKSSLVFGTIAAESQRLISETYRAFVQGFMPTLARPDVDVLEGLSAVPGRP